MLLGGICLCSAIFAETDAPEAEKRKSELAVFAQGSANETKAQREERINAWRSDRFGMFIHWGPVSLTGKEIAWSRIGERRDKKGGGPKSVTPALEYDNLYKHFNPEKFNADEWVGIAKAAGMKYIVFVAKCHDGFCMFDSALTDYKITNTPFKRDVAAELAEACRKAGLKFGFYYSPPDWYHPDYFTAEHARYITYLHGQIRELLTKYGLISELWFDGLGNKSETWDAPALIKMVRELQPNVLINNRCGWGGDFYTPEQRIRQFDLQHPWETCAPIGTQWAWKPNDELKSLKFCLEILVTVAGRDGNLLLDVGPEPTGVIEPRQVEILKGMGDWLAKYGESIYGTRGGPFTPYKSFVAATQDGSTVIKTPSETDGYVSTRKGNTVYLHVFKWPEGALQLPAIPAKIVSSGLLTGGKVTVSQTDKGIVVSVPAVDRQAVDTIVKLELDRPATDIVPVDPLPETAQSQQAKEEK